MAGYRKESSLSMKASKRMAHRERHGGGLNELIDFSWINVRLAILKGLSEFFWGFKEGFANWPAPLPDPD